MPAPKLTKASVANALAAAIAVDLTPSAMTVMADGSIRLEFLTGELNTAANDDEPATADDEPATATERQAPSYGE